MPRPSRFVTPSAVSSIVPGTLSVVGAPSTLRPLTYTVAPAAPSSRAMPRPAPRLAPVTSATTLLSCAIGAEMRQRDRLFVSRPFPLLTLTFASPVRPHLRESFHVDRRAL